MTLETFFPPFFSIKFSYSFLGKDKVPDLLDDLFVTIDMFRTEEYLPEDYKKQLIEEGIFIEDVKCNGILSKEEKYILDGWHRGRK